jgi:L-fuconolactonase
MKIDAHHHLWQYEESEYSWITNEKNILRRDFLPKLLKAELARTQIDATIAMQARQSLEETTWLLEQCEDYPWIIGIVGWVPFTHVKVEKHLEKFSKEFNCLGMRHRMVIEKDSRYMLRDDFNRGISLLKQFNLSFDLEIHASQLPTAREFVDRHPEQIFILNHMANPAIREKAFEDWDIEIRKLAERENVFCKLSGLATQCKWHMWTENDLKPYIETALEAFGPQRLIFGSDWPICLLSSQYERWVRAAQKLISTLSPVEKAQIMGETALAAYGLEVEES